MVDQMTARAAQLYGQALKTPNLERLAQRGLLYERAYCAHPLCVPSRISTWTASYSHSTGAQTNEDKVPKGRDTAFHVWREAGYRTGLIGKNHCFDRVSTDHIFDVWCEISHWGIPEGARTKGLDWPRSNDQIAAANAVRRDMPDSGGPVSVAVTGFPVEDYATALVCEQTIRFLQSCDERPFAAWVSIPDPHGPYEVPEAYARLIDPDAVELPPSPEAEFDDAPERNRILAHFLRWPDEERDGLRTAVARYLAMIAFIDDQLGRILDELDRLELTDTTIVAFCSDHGDFAGEHAMMGKGGAFYDCLTRVPLVLAGPGFAESRKVADPVSLIDLVPTILSAQGLRSITSSDGRPLPAASDQPPRAHVFAEYGRGAPLLTEADVMSRNLPAGHEGILATLEKREHEGQRSMVVEGSWKAVHDPMGDRDELYDLNADPFELTNLARSPRHAARMARLRASIVDWRP
jgi:arylsulfatase A-like enzyme